MLSHVHILIGCTYLIAPGWNMSLTALWAAGQKHYPIQVNDVKKITDPDPKPKKLCSRMDPTLEN